MNTNGRGRLTRGCWRGGRGGLILWCFLSVLPSAVGAAPHSDATQECLACHVDATPGIVSDWQRSRHAETTPADALQAAPLHRKVSSEEIPQSLQGTSVGCAECHTLNPQDHKDTVEHNGYSMHVVVTPRDCRTCHRQEADQYGENIMAHAYGNLVNNSLYVQLTESINGIQVLESGRLKTAEVHPQTNDDACLSCHGTRVEVQGTVSRETDLGEMDFPVLTGWPNVGVGRLNPDGSKGSCSSCHARHAFSIEVARKPDTCSQCHKGPDVPAYKVYQVSKHGNIYASQKDKWNFRNVPWVVGKDFNAPTCAACHVSLLVDEGGNVVAQRTHRMNDRLPWRIFGLIYSHAHPKNPDTSSIRNAQGLALPTNLDGSPVKEALIDGEEQERRRANLHAVCLGCHSTSWVEGHWDRFQKTLEETNRMTRTATEIMGRAWERGIARGPGSDGNPFDEPMEKLWVEQWLFFANSIRFSSAMMGSDYGVFDNGRWYQSKGLREMMRRLEMGRPGARDDEKP
ncbi:Seven times multi-haem cytochrome CxxCH [Desulfacinum infernum DSM 9756]|uniref:Seven times multi-haem cytochrome CxxCH n=1 Tax=Desulfacinum infernum DSM 9756 TaxID=1121391 RepID=A0A1M5GX53_9BACT|nr:multiheme c-type cytochrome [Desulfacinum infernum]SHG08257.1 Seven times multi-haem cytochrome CxxCH [Desulfacinum infernum DSM 9756]